MHLSGECTPVSLEETDSRESEDPGFFIGRRGMFQGDQEGARMPVSSRQTVWTSNSPLFPGSLGIAYLLIGGRTFCQVTSLLTDVKIPKFYWGSVSFTVSRYQRR